MIQTGGHEGGQSWTEDSCSALPGEDEDSAQGEDVLSAPAEAFSAEQLRDVACLWKNASIVVGMHPDQVRAWPPRPGLSATTAAAASRVQSFNLISRAMQTDLCSKPAHDEDDSLHYRVILFACIITKYTQMADSQPEIATFSYFVRHPCSLIEHLDFIAQHSTCLGDQGAKAMFMYVQATEPIVEFARLTGKPFAVVPCCVFPKEFPMRCLDRQPVRVYDEFIQYLVSLAPEHIQVADLMFEGRNKVVFCQDWAVPYALQQQNQHTEVLPGDGHK